jgi:hypothetical protein
MVPELADGRKTECLFMVPELVEGYKAKTFPPPLRKAKRAAHNIYFSFPSTSSGTNFVLLNLHLKPILLHYGHYNIPIQNHRRLCL